MIRVSNRFRGSVKEGVFEHELDRRGNWIPTDNIRIVVDDCDIEDVTLPSVLTAKKIESLAKSKPSLVYSKDTDYDLVETTPLEEVKDYRSFFGLFKYGVVRYPKATAYIYQPHSNDLNEGGNV